MIAKMNKLVFSEEECIALRKRLKCDLSWRMKERIRILFLLSMGSGYKEVVEKLDLNRKIVEDTLLEWVEYKFDSLVDIHYYAEKKVEHLELLKKPFIIDSEIQNQLSASDVDKICKYGTWMQALVIGTLRPITDMQKEFIASARKGDISISECINDFSRLWITYSSIQKKIEKKRMEEIRKIREEREAESDNTTSWHSSCQACNTPLSRCRCHL